jgi:hypothetical protein
MNPFSPIIAGPLKNLMGLQIQRAETIAINSYLVHLVFVIEYKDM